jgi:hypothetical protein
MPACPAVQKLHLLPMTSKRRKVVLVLVGVLVAGAFGVLVVEPFLSREGPVTNGKPLSVWVETFGTHTVGSPSRKSASAAIRASGTDAFPFLLKWLPHEEKPWRRKIGPTLQPWAYEMEDISIGWSRAEKRAQGVPDAFAVLYPMAPPPSVIVELSNHLNNSACPETASRAASCLAQLGRRGVPPLAAVLLTTNHPMRRSVAVACIQPNVPNPVMAPAIPLLLTWLEDPNANISEDLTNALKQIAPEVLRNAPAQ